MVMNELQHYGILGMKWGVRRYQDANGNYTAAGRKRYLDDKTASLKGDKSKKEAKLGRKYDLKKTEQEINLNTGIGEKMVYNSATRKLAAKFVVDKNMPMDEAINKSKKVALRNTALFVAGYSALTLASIRSMK